MSANADVVKPCGFGGEGARPPAGAGLLDAGPDVDSGGALEGGSGADAAGGPETTGAPGTAAGPEPATGPDAAPAGEAGVDGIDTTGAPVLVGRPEQAVIASAIKIALHRIAGVIVAMWMLGLEAVAALTLLIFIVWWSMSSPRKPARKPPDDRSP